MRLKLWTTVFLVVFGIAVMAAEDTSSTGSTVESARGDNGEESPSLSAGIDLQFTPITYNSYDWANGVNNPARGTGVQLAVEWIPFGDVPYGKPAIGIGTGMQWISKVAITNSSSASLYTIPVEPYLAYRLDYFKNQILVPFVKAGLNWAFIHQGTDTITGHADSNFHSLSFDYALGGQFNLNVIDRKSARNLNKSIGIDNTYIIFEFVKSRSLGPDYGPNLSHEEYRIGLRFEA